MGLGIFLFVHAMAKVAFAQKLARQKWWWQAWFKRGYTAGERASEYQHAGRDTAIDGPVGR